MTDPMRASPTKVVGHERRIDLVRETTHCIEIRLVERSMAEQVEPDAMQHDRITRPHALEVLPRSRCGTEEILGDHLEVIDGRRMRQHVFVVRNAKPQSKGIRRKA